jgi:hypothetical protein
MTDQSKPDPWASLASELGIEPPVGQPEAEPQVVAADSSPAPELSSAPASAPIPALPPAKVPPRKPPERTRPASDWDTLANELGIPPESLPREQPAPPPARREEPVARQEVPASRVEPVEPEFQEPEVLEPSIFGEEAGGFAETVDLMEDTIEFTERAADTADTAESPAESEEQRSSRRRRKRRRRGRGGSRTDAPQTATEQTDLALPAAPEEVPAAGTAGDEIATDEAVAREIPGDEAGDEERSGRRRSRRSGRRRKRRPEGAEPREKTAGQPEAEAGADDARPPREFRPERSEFAPRDDADDADEANDDFADGAGDDFADEAGDDKELRVGHRAIPTWDEAIGLIIAKNMESRAKRPNGGQARGHGGRDRRGGSRRSSGGK